MPNINGIMLFILSSTVLGYTILYPIAAQLSNSFCSFFGHFLTALHVGNKGIAHVHSYVKFFEVCLHIGIVM